MSFNSSIDALVRYQKTRVPWSIFAALALFLCIASATGGWPMDAAAWCRNGVLALCLVVQFRLWDDLADVEHDRLIHPGRVLCQTQSHQLFWCTLGLLGLVNAVWIASFKPYPLLGVFLVLNVWYFLWYSLFRKGIGDRLLAHGLVLVKYPVFVFLLSGSHSEARAGLPLGYGMLMTLLCFCSYELQHDQQLRAHRHATRLLACEFSALVLVAILMLIELRRSGSTLAFVQAGLLVVGSMALAYLFQQYRVLAAPGWWRFGVFFVALAWLLNFAWGCDQPFEPTRGDAPAASHDRARFPKGNHT